MPLLHPSPVYHLLHGKPSLTFLMRKIPLPESEFCFLTVHCLLTTVVY